MTVASARQRHHSHRDRSHVTRPMSSDAGGTRRSADISTCQRDRIC